MKKNTLPRRNFLKHGGMAALAGGLLQSPIQMLIQSLIDGVINQAIAQTNGSNPRSYVYLYMTGAPSGFTWNHFCTPYSSTGYVHNPGFGNRYRATNGVYTDVEYSTVNLLGVNAPPLWATSVAAPGGNMRPMTDLLRHLLLVQGISTGNPAHPGSQALQFLPLGAQQSIMAMSGDASNAPIPGINVGNSRYVYKSTKGKGALNIRNLNNALADILSPFSRTVSTQFASNRSVVETAVSQASNALNELAHSKHPAAVAISDNMRNAKAVVESGVANYGNASSVLTSKYRDIITRTLSPTIVLPGFNDLPIGIAGTRDRRYGYGQNIIVNNSDLRSMHVATTGGPAMANLFAVLEYVLTNRLTSSFAANLGPIGGLVINGAQTVQIFDEHGEGIMPTTLITALFYRAVSACLLELIEVLKARGMFNNTVINVGGEFAREPRASGMGSDHGFRASQITAFTGLVQQPLIIGNIRNRPPTPQPIGRDDWGNYPGTWGDGGPINALGGATLDLGHSTSTLAALLGVPSPITAKPSLVVVQNGSVVPTIETTRIT